MSDFAVPCREGPAGLRANHGEEQGRDPAQFGLADLRRPCAAWIVRPAGRRAQSTRARRAPISISCRSVLQIGGDVAGARPRSDHGLIYRGTDDEHETRVDAGGSPRPSLK